MRSRGCCHREVRHQHRELDDPQLGEGLEVYLTDPRAEPDVSQWETEVAYLISDEASFSRLSPSNIVWVLCERPSPLVMLIAATASVADNIAPNTKDSGQFMPGIK